MAPIGYSGAKGTLIRESLKSKSAWQTPFKLKTSAYPIFCVNE
jgi:hypothetical protein